MVGGNSVVVRMFWTVSRAAVLAVADRNFVKRHTRQIMAPAGSFFRSISTGGTWTGASGYDLLISRFPVCWTLRRFLHGVSST